MKFTVAHIQSLSEITCDPVQCRLDLVYTVAHRAAAGREMQVRIDGDALRALVTEIRRLEAEPQRPLDMLFAGARST